MELGLGGRGHGDGVGVGGGTGAVGAFRPAASSCAGAGTAPPELFLSVSSLGGTYRPREDSRVMPTGPEASAQSDHVKSLSISDPSVVPVSPDPTGTPGSGTPWPTATQDALKFGGSFPGGPFFAVLLTGARAPQACLGGQRAIQSGWGGGVGSCPWRTGETVSS